MSGYRLGVDLGTTFTAAAIHGEGITRMLPLGRRQPEIPSVIAVLDEEVLVGDAAERVALTEPEALAREFKRRIGDSTPIMLKGSPWPAEALMGHLLSHVLAVAKTLEGSPPSSLTITHPANWGEFKLDRLRQATLQAGREDALFMSEPVAAAQYYASQGRISDGQTVAVFDLGGGTFDAAVVRNTGRQFALLGQPKGLEQLGGIDLDQAILSHVLESLEIDVGELEDTPENRQAMHRMRLDCREAKEALSADTAASVPIMLPGAHTHVRITRQEFEAMIRLPLGRAIKTLAAAIEAAGLQLEDVDGVLLVGGSSRIPIVAQMIGEELRLPVMADAHPKHTIVSGAALEQVVAIEPTTPSRSPATEPRALADLPAAHVSGDASTGAGSIEVDRRAAADDWAVEDPGPAPAARAVETDRNGVDGRGSRRVWLATLVCLLVLVTVGAAVALRDGEQDVATPVESSIADTSAVGGTTSSVPGSDLDAGAGSIGTTTTALSASGLDPLTLAGVRAVTHRSPYASGVSAAAGDDGQLWLLTIFGGGLKFVVVDTETRETLREIEFDERPVPPLLTDRYAFVPVTSTAELVVVDRSTLETVTVIDMGFEDTGLSWPTSPTLVGDEVWVGDRESGEVAVIAVESLERIDLISVDEGAFPGYGSLLAGPVYDGDLLWTTHLDRDTAETVVSGIDPLSRQVVEQTRVEASFTEQDPLVTPDGLWVPGTGSGTLVTREGQATVSNLGDLITGSAVSDGLLWVASSQSFNVKGTVKAIDTTEPSIVSQFGIESFVLDVEEMSGLLWISTASNRLFVVDPKTEEVVATFDGVGETSLTEIDGLIWLNGLEMDDTLVLDPSRLS